MENRCQRCDRVLSDPDAVFGWRCAEILGVSGELSKMGADIFRKFVNGAKKVQKLFGNSDFEFTDEQWKKLYSAFAKMSLWDGVDERKVKEARKEGYKVKVVEGEKIMEDKLPKADAYILSFWNSDNVMDALHTVAMRRTKDGKYELFNYESRTDNKSKITSNFVYELLENREIPLSVHCISK